MNFHSIFRDGIEPVSGFLAPELAHFGYFVDTDRRFTIRLAQPSRYISLHLASNGIKGTLGVQNATKRLGDIPLELGWMEYPFDLGGVLDGEISFTLRPSETRGRNDGKPGIALRKITAFDSAHRMHSLSRQLQNKLLNRREFKDGKVVLQSTPPGLRITLVSECNIKPPCAYCEWDWAKSMETDLYASNENILASIGEFYLNAENVIECSYGEPMTYEALPEVIRDIGRTGKLFSITSNGVLLNRMRQDMFLGRNMFFYVSMDAASAESYARFRTEKFDLVVKNLKTFCARKKKHGDLPTVVVSFLLMRSNLHELPEFVHLMESIGVDGIKLRSLYMEGMGKDAPLERSGGVFDYHREILSEMELMEAVRQVKEMTRGSELRIFEGFEFGNLNAEKDQPLCSEPWLSLWLLKRGVMHCRFSKVPIMKLSDLPKENLHDAVRALWNGEEYQELRRALANHQFPRLCLETPSCPIVRKSKALGCGERSGALSLELREP